MKSLLLLSAVFLSAAAYAHVEPGVYQGITSDGQACEMHVIEMKFESGMHHPLTERVVIEVAGDVFTVGHPSAIVREDSQITFNHDLFQGILPNENGAKALVVEMTHSQQFEGPTAFEVIDHNWRTNSSEKIRCNDIQIKK